MHLPGVPMSPIHATDIPAGDDWGYQLKWDGIRALARLDGAGGVELFGKKLEPRNNTYPAIVKLLGDLRIGPCVLDGEIVFFDGSRPNFQRVRVAAGRQQYTDSLLFIAFDMLYDSGEDIRRLPFIDRYQRLAAALPRSENQRIIVSDLFRDGMLLWDWVIEHKWEGIVSKRLSSPYSEGKKHKDWLKKRKSVDLTVEVVGVKLHYGVPTSLVLRYDGQYIGQVSGLDLGSKKILSSFIQNHTGSCPFTDLPLGSKNGPIVWLAMPFLCNVSALEITEHGVLRQAKIIGFGAGSSQM